MALTKKQLSSVRLVAFDFDGVFTDKTVFVCQDGKESVRCWRGDGLGLARLRSVGVRSCVLSTEKNPVVKKRADKIGVPCHHGLSDKASAIKKICREWKIPLSLTMFVGNDINDTPAWRVVGMPVAVADAATEVLAHVVFRTRRRGGFGAVREICDKIFHAQKPGPRKK